MCYKIIFCYFTNFILYYSNDFIAITIMVLMSMNYVMSVKNYMNMLNLEEVNTHGGDNKSFCANCPIHCYKPDMRQKIRDVMRHSGSRITFVHPVIAMRHLIETKKEKKKIAKLGVEKAKQDDFARLKE